MMWALVYIILSIVVSLGLIRFNYTPDNCRWVTMLVQENNKRNNHYIIYDGERMTLSQCAKKANVSRNSLYYWTCVKSMTAEEAIENIKERQLSISV